MGSLGGLWKCIVCCILVLQAANVCLQDQLYAAQQQLMHQQPNTVDVQALKRRLEDITKALLAYRVTHY